MKYIAVKNLIIAIYHHTKQGAILVKISTIDKVDTRLLIYYLLYFKYTNILKQKCILFVSLLLEQMPYRILSVK